MTPGRRRVGGLPLVLSFLFAIVLTGCLKPLVEAGQPSTANGVLRLNETSSLGQSFMAYQGGLQGIEFALASGTAERPAGIVSFQLRRSAASDEVLAEGTVDVSRLSGSSLRVDFPPQSAERLIDYYISLQFAGKGGFDLLAGSANSYLNGAAYQNGQPVEAQLSFRLVHEPVRVAVGIAALAGQWLALGTAAATLLVAPGLCLLLFLPPALRRRSGLLDLILLAPGVSVAIYPLLIALTGLIGTNLGAAYALMPISLAGAFLAVRLYNRRLTVIRELRARLWPGPERIVFVILAGTVVFTRLWVIRGIDLPMWGDGYQHSVLVQLLLDHGGLFDSWQPYADMTTLTYHIGFHAFSACLGWLIGLDAPRATLWAGQFLNVSAVLILYPVARRLSGSAWAGVIAVAFAGLISAHPAYFVNWGRYTQLAGLVALPALIWLIVANQEGSRVENRQPNQSAWLVTGVVWGGVAITHYRVLVLAIAFTAVFGMVIVCSSRSRVHQLVALTVPCLVGLGLFFPWLLHTFSGSIPTAGMSLMSTPAPQLDGFLRSYNAMPDLASVLPGWVWTLALGSVVLGIWRRSWSLCSLACWAAASWLVTNPDVLSLPGSGVVSNFALVLSAYVPVSLIVTGGLTELVAMLSRRRLAYGIVALAVWLGLSVAAITGVVQRLADSQPQSYSLAHHPDARAAAWIQNSLSVNARFLVNSFAAYGGALVAGSDGGWWLPLLARRGTTQPPLNYTSERLPTSTYSEEVSRLHSRLRAEGLSDSNLRALWASGITHIYVGQSRGLVGSEEPALLDVSALLQNQRLNAVYRQDRVLIFEINYPSGSPP